MGEWIKIQSHLDQKNSMMPLAKTFTYRWVYAYRKQCVLGPIYYLLLISPHTNILALYDQILRLTGIFCSLDAVLCVS